MGEFGSFEADALVLKYNKAAIDSLKLENYREALSILKVALNKLNAPETDLQNWPNRLRLLGITLNNFGCLYRNKGQLNVALLYLQKALAIEQETGHDSISTARTNLNICAILSQLNRHEAALQHAQQALNTLKAQYEMETGSEAEEYANEDIQGGQNLRLTLIVAYHNVAAELEHLNNVEEAIAMYDQADELAKNELDPSNPLRTTVKCSSEKARIRGKNLSIMLSERQILRSRARVTTHERSRSPGDVRGPIILKGLEPIQRLPSIKQGIQKRTQRASGSPNPRLKTGKQRFERLNYSLRDPKERSKTPFQFSSKTVPKSPWNLEGLNVRSLLVHEYKGRD